MSIRPLDLLDLPTVYRYRGEAVSLDPARLLTRGNPLGAMGMMAYVNPRRHIYSAVSDNDGATLLGGIIHTNGESFRQITLPGPGLTIGRPRIPGIDRRPDRRGRQVGRFPCIGRSG